MAHGPTASRLSRPDIRSSVIVLLGLALLASMFTLVATPSSAQAVVGLRKGMTWTVLEQQTGYVHVGSDAQTNPYSGDTTVDQYQSALCLRHDGTSPVGGVSFHYYMGWAQAQVKITAPIRGDQLTSQAQADALCTTMFGTGWKLAEFHDGRYGANFENIGGWTYWAGGKIPAGTRFWVAINDQPANPWNSVGTLPPPLPAAGDDLVLKTKLQGVMEPLLGFAATPAFRNIVTTGVGERFDGDDNVLVSTVIARAEAAGVVSNATPGWTAFKYAIGEFAYVNGTSYRPQIAIPNYGDGALPGSTITITTYESDLNRTALPAYSLDGAGNLQLLSTAVDETYAETHEVWVLSTNEDVTTLPPVLAKAGKTTKAKAGAPAKAVAPKTGGSAPATPQGTFGTTAVCNPTGLRNNNGAEYLSWYQVPNPSSVEHWTAGKLEPRLFVIGKGGTTIIDWPFGKVKRKNAKNGITVNLLEATWDRVALGDYWAYKWIEEDKGPTITLSLGLPKWITDKILNASVTAQFTPNDDDMGAGLVTFTDSTYLQYATPIVRWTVCSVGGDGGTGNTNLALAATAAASSTFSGYSPARVNDGDENTSLGGAYSWANAGGTWPPGKAEWVQLDFGTNKTFSKVVIFTSSGYPIRDFDIEVWNGTSWVAVSTVTGNTALSITRTFAPQNARLVRVLGHSGPTHQQTYVRVNEFEVYA